MSAVAAGAHAAFSAAQPAAPGEAIRLVRLSKRFAVRRGWRAALRHPVRRQWAPALEDITCTIEDGEFFGLLGPNGAGKTTLFKVLATLVLPDGGSASVGGYDVVHQARRVRNILAPVIADDRSLYWRLSARENLELYARLQDLPDDAARRRVSELLEAVGLDDAGRKMVGAFSSGMKQRLLIARALVARPRILLFDEPTRSLDPLSARTFRFFLREEISARQGCTVLLATHNTEEALELCGRVGVLHQGRLLAVGAAADLSRQMGNERYRLWSRWPVQGSLAALEREGVVGQIVVQPDAEGWARVDMDVAGGLEGASQILDALSRAGASVARFESVPRSLADLIEGIIARRRDQPMRRVSALVRASWLTAASYRFNMLVSLASLLAMVIPVYFVAGALQPVMAKSIEGQGGEYFAFLLVGIITLMFLTTAVTSLPTALGSSIASGTFEALLGTRARLGEIVAGLVGYAFIWTATRALLLLVVGWLLGAPLLGQQLPAGLLILGLIILTYLPFGLFAAAGVLAFKTNGSLPAAVLTVSGLLGGVYYPTHVIPSWLQDLSTVVPLTYGLRALRAVVLEGGPLSASTADLAILVGFALVLCASSLYVFTLAVRHAKGSGTLAQY